MSAAYSYDHPRPALAVDIAVVSSDGHVLLIRRRHEPFMGQFALPGGFVNIDETVAQAAARELEEETGLTGIALRQFGIFDDPRRDPRGRTISIAFVALVENRIAPRPGSDAADANWFPLRSLPPIAFDHDRIIAQAVEAAAGLRAG